MIDFIKTIPLSPTTELGITKIIDCEHAESCLITENRVRGKYTSKIFVDKDGNRYVRRYGIKLYLN